jgi:hypothetical protein
MKYHNMNSKQTLRVKTYFECFNRFYMIRVANILTRLELWFCLLTLIPYQPLKILQKNERDLKKLRLVIFVIQYSKSFYNEFLDPKNWRLSKFRNAKFKKCIITARGLLTFL